MTVTVGINGFGRIGRCTLAHIAESGRNDIHVAKINATGPIETNAHLLRYDSVHGRFPGTVSIDNNALDLGCGPIDVMSHMIQTSWIGAAAMSFWNAQDSSMMEIYHAFIFSGAKAVLISAPAKNVDKTIVYGVNHRDLIPMTP